jgi:hypothetical protein
MTTFHSKLRGKLTFNLPVLNDENHRQIACDMDDMNHVRRIVMPFWIKP